MSKHFTVNCSDTIYSLSDYINRIDTLEHGGTKSNFLYRGQDVEDNLIPAVARRKPTLDTTEIEKSMLEDMRLMGGEFLKGSENNDLEHLVLAQHYGMKTRLLDWSSNPLVALWFACNTKKKSDVYVYVFDFKNFLKKELYSKDPFSLEKTCAFRPRLNSSRITAQHGWFTIHRYSKADRRFVALEKNTNIKNHITKLTVAESCIPDLLDSLDKCGISNRTLFPDLEGLCVYQNWKYKI